MTPLKKKFEIKKREEELAKTDFIGHKAIEGYDCDTLYPGWKERRKQLRDEINAIEDGTYEEEE